MLLIISLALIFISKLRFPAHTPISRIITRRYGEAVLRTFRKLERTYYKEDKLKCDISYLSYCKCYDIQPNFLRFKINSSNFQNSDAYKKFQRDLLNNELLNANKKLKRVTDERVSLENELQTSVSYIDAKCLKAKLHNFVAKSIETVKKRHTKNYCGWELIHNHTLIQKTSFLIFEFYIETRR